MPGALKHPRLEVAVAEGGMILIKQLDGVTDDRAVVTVHPADLPALIESLSKLRAGQQDPEPSEPPTR